MTDRPASQPNDPAAVENPAQALERLRTAHATLKTELHRVIVGQDAVIDEILIAILCRGHVLLEGVPGCLLYTSDAADE